MSETKVKNVTEFLKKLTKIQNNKSDDTELFFRGQANKIFEAEPTIFRKNGNGERNLLKNEKHLFNDMITQCPEDFKDCQYTFEYLVKMQHYGLSTRLLDITSNALVALYFACYSNHSDEFSKDGKVFVYTVRKDTIKNYNSDTVSVLANLAQLDNDFKVFTRAQEDEFEKLEQSNKEYLRQISELSSILRRFAFVPKKSEFLEKCIKIQDKINTLEQDKKLMPAQEKEFLKLKEKLKQQKEQMEQEIEKQKLLLKYEAVVFNTEEEVVDAIVEVANNINKQNPAFQILKNLKNKKERFLHFIKQEKSYFIDKIDDEKDVQKIVCVQAKLNNQRIIRQSGLFFLFGMGKTKADPIKFSDYIKFEYTKRIQADREYSIQEITNPTIIISAAKKADILKELRTLGISKETLMPEIDTVASMLKDRYN